MFYLVCLTVKEVHVGDLNCSFLILIIMCVSVRFLVREIW